jgi:hypothetical protein
MARAKRLEIHLRGNPSLPHRLFQPLMQSFAKTYRQIERPIIGNQHQDVARGIEHGGAMAAIGEMQFDLIAQLRRDRSVDVVGNLFPDVPAI